MNRSNGFLSRLVIRGAPDDFATLCTTDQVFEIKSAETSNTLLLASPIDSSSANKENGCVLLKVERRTVRFRSINVSVGSRSTRFYMQNLN